VGDAHSSKQREEGRVIVSLTGTNHSPASRPEVRTPDESREPHESHLKTAPRHHPHAAVTAVPKISPSSMYHWQYRDACEVADVLLVVSYLRWTPACYLYSAAPRLLA